MDRPNQAPPLGDHRKERAGDPMCS